MELATPGRAPSETGCGVKGRSEGVENPMESVRFRRFVGSWEPFVDNNPTPALIAWPKSPFEM